MLKITFSLCNRSVLFWNPNSQNLKMFFRNWKCFENRFCILKMAYFDFTSNQFEKLVFCSILKLFPNQLPYKSKPPRARGILNFLWSEFKFIFNLFSNRSWSFENILKLARGIWYRINYFGISKKYSPLQEARYLYFTYSTLISSIDNNKNTVY